MYWLKNKGEGESLVQQISHPPDNPLFQSSCLIHLTGTVNVVVVVVVVKPKYYFSEFVLAKLFAVM